MSPLSNLAVRDVETLVHPYINLASFRETGPLVIERAQGVYRLRYRRQGLYRGHGRALVHGARLRQRGAGRDCRRADAKALLRALVHRQEPRSGDRACRKAQGDRAGPDLESVLLQFRIGGERHPDQARLVLSTMRAAGRRRKRSSAASRPITGSPWQRPRSPGCRAIIAISICRCRAFCTPGVRITIASRRTARARRISHSRLAVELEALIVQRRPGHGGGLHRRAGDGRGRRDRAAGDLFREDHAGLRASTICSSSATR